MTVEQVCETLGAAPVWEGADLKTEVSGGYAGDFLSWVMSRLRAGNVWLTVMGNVNTIAVAVLAEAGCVVLCEDAPFDDDALARAKGEGLPVLRTSLPVFEAAVKLGALPEAKR